MAGAFRKAFEIARNESAGDAAFYLMSRAAKRYARIAELVFGPFGSYGSIKQRELSQYTRDEMQPSQMPNSFEAGDEFAHERGGEDDYRWIIQ